jgi:hypothetical protein
MRFLSRDDGQATTPRIAIILLRDPANRAGFGRLHPI